MGKLSKGAAALFFSSVASVATAGSCLDNGQSAENVQACIKDQVNNLYRVQNGNTGYQLYSGTNILGLHYDIFKIQNEKMAMEINLAWDTVRAGPDTESLMQTVSLSDLNSDSRNVVRSYLRNACTGFKGQLSKTMPQISRDIDGYSKMAGVSPGQVAGLKAGLESEQSRIGYAVELNCN